MSRAFVKEAEDAVEDFPERPISTAPNLVTREGLAAIEAEIAQLAAALAPRAKIAANARASTAICAIGPPGAAAPTCSHHRKIAASSASAAP